jgi:hypothetical protein
MRPTSRAIAVASVIAALALTGCGSNGSSTAGSSGTPSDQPSNVKLDATQLRRVDQCLWRAHLAPFGAPPTGISGAPVGKPTATVSPGSYSDPKVVRALAACHIVLPGVPPHTP